MGMCPNPIPPPPPPANRTWPYYIGFYWIEFNWNWIELKVYLFLKTVEQSKQFEHSWANMNFKKGRDIKKPKGLKGEAPPTRYIMFMHKTWNIKGKTKKDTKITRYKTIKIRIATQLALQFNKILCIHVCPPPHTHTHNFCFFFYFFSCQLIPLEGINPDRCQRNCNKTCLEKDMDHKLDQTYHEISSYLESIYFSWPKSETRHQLEYVAV